MAFEIPKKIAESKTNTDLVRNLFGSLWESITGKEINDGKKEEEEGKTALQTSGEPIPDSKAETR